MSYTNKSKSDIVMKEKVGEHERERVLMGRPRSGQNDEAVWRQTDQLTMTQHCRQTLAYPAPAHH